MLSYQPGMQADADSAGYGRAQGGVNPTPPNHNPSAKPASEMSSHARVQCRVCGLLLNVYTGQILPLRCKSWLCPLCGPKKVSSYVLRINPHPWVWFLTLTLDGVANPERETFKRLAAGWKHVRQYLKRHGMVNYTWVREQGHNATRRVHLHVVFDGPRQVVGCSTRCAKRHKHVYGMRRAVERSGLGIWFKLEKVKSARHVKRYVTKYLSKDIATWRWPKGTRRCQTTIPRFRDEGWILLRPPAYVKWTWFNSNHPNPDLYLTKMEKDIRDGVVQSDSECLLLDALAKPAQAEFVFPRAGPYGRAME